MLSELTQWPAKQQTNWLESMPQSTLQSPLHSLRCWCCCCCQRVVCAICICWNMTRRDAWRDSTRLWCRFDSLPCHRIKLAATDRATSLNWQHSLPVFAASCCCCIAGGTAINPPSMPLPLPPTSVVCLVLLCLLLLCTFIITLTTVAICQAFSFSFWGLQAFFRIFCVKNCVENADRQLILLLFMHKANGNRQSATGKRAALYWFTFCRALIADSQPTLVQVGYYWELLAISQLSQAGNRV